MWVPRLAEAEEHPPVQSRLVSQSNKPGTNSASYPACWHSDVPIWTPRVPVQPHQTGRWKLSQRGGPVIPPWRQTPRVLHTILMPLPRPSAEQRRCAHSPALTGAQCGDQTLWRRTPLAAGAGEWGGGSGCWDHLVQPRCWLKPDAAALRSAP